MLRCNLYGATLRQCWPVGDQNQDSAPVKRYFGPSKILYCGPQPLARKGVRYWPGVLPVYFLNTALNDDLELKPASMASSSKVLSGVDLANSATRLIRS